MKRNKMCPICHLKRLFSPAKSASDNSKFPPYESGAPLAPPMGWSSWNTFRNRINEDLVFDMAKTIAESGLKDAGYIYVNMDDNWQSSARDENGDLQGDLETFPHGIPALVEKVNALGLKLGAYTSNGTLTCEDLPASLGRERADAYTLAKWGIEYFKYDFCHNIPISKYAPLVYSISIYGGGTRSEYTVHNAILHGYARFMTDKSLPTGGYVSGLDEGRGDITYDNIQVENEGDYVLTVNIKKHGQYEKYLIAEVNGVEYEINFPSQKKHNNTARFQTTVHLKSGKNTIRLYNPISSRADSEMYEYRRMGIALKDGAERVAKETGKPVKPIRYSICEWGWGKPQKWGATAGNLWRTTPDIRPWWPWIKLIYEHNVKLYKYASAGHYNDPDMLEVGNGKLSRNQNISHFSLWCMMSAPLILGNDLGKMTDEIKAIVTNRQMIEIDQDALCKQAKRVKRGSVDVLAKPLVGGKVALCFFNKSGSAKSGSYDIQKLTQDAYVALAQKSSYNLTEVWSGEQVETSGKIKTKLQKHQTKVYIINA